MDEEDTFRILSRKPLSEIFHDIHRSRVVLAAEFVGLEGKFQQIVESNGYTLEEYFEYERQFLKQAILDNIQRLYHQGNIGKIV